MDEPHRCLHGTLLELCRRRSLAAARQERRGGSAVARAKAPPESPMESNAGPKKHRE
jgi:hypothetical protein